MRLVVFALAVFVLRVGLVAACAPGDLAESLSIASDSGATVATDTDTDGGKAHDSGHCLHCGCHFPATLPVVDADPLNPALGVAVETRDPTWPNAPPDRLHRPPIT